MNIAWWHSFRYPQATKCRPFVRQLSSSFCSITPYARSIRMLRPAGRLAWSVVVVVAVGVAVVVPRVLVLVSATAGGVIAVGVRAVVVVIIAAVVVVRVVT